MTPPVRSAHGRNSGDHRGKDFTPNLGPIDSQAPVSNSAWDSETDHILSFFLGGEAGPHGNPNIPDFASVASHPGNPSLSSHENYLNPLMRGSGSSGELKDFDDDDGAYVPPPTPAVNFYHAQASGASPYTSVPARGSLKQEQQQQASQGLPGTSMTSSSSSSSLSSIAQALVTGGPLVYQQLHTYPQGQAQQRQQRTSSPMDHISPISPAALIGNGENLMLPPPLPGGSHSREPSIPSNVTTSTEANIVDRERHLAWLRDLNAMAKGSSAAGSVMPQAGHSTGNSQPVSSLNPSPSFSLAHSGSVPSTVPSHATFPHQVQAMVPASHSMVFNVMSVPPERSKQAAESAEKRAKRLERNRESARKSRRRKKERLASLEEKVNKLHGEIEVDRKIQINAMVGALCRCRASAQFTGETNVVFNTGPCSEISRSVLDYQYSALKQLILPRYHKFLLWLTLQQESYFVAAKEEYAIRENKLVRSASGKVSSKQIGDEMTNGVGGGASKKRVTFEGNDGNSGDKGTLSPHANDGSKVWPLFCYELSFSVDQEDRFVATCKRLQETTDLSTTRSQVAAAVRTGDRLREAMESLSRRVAEREQNTLNGILSQPQVAVYQQWLSSNRERCVNILQRRDSDKPSSVALPVETSLDDICQRLNEVLQISNPE